MLGVIKRNTKRSTALLVGASLAVFLFLLALGWGAAVSAGAVDVGINAVPGLEEAPDIRIVIARIIRIALGFLGILAVSMILWGGFQWMTSGGEEEKISGAKKTIINASIGLAIILSAFAITQFVLQALIAATTGGTFGGEGTSDGATPRSGSLGRGIIEMHYPPRLSDGGTDIARNTNIMITFKVPVDLASVIDGYDDNNTPDNLADDPLPLADSLNTNTVKIYKALEGPTNALASNQVAVRFTPDRKTFVFDPVDFLGSASENVLYTVELPGDGLRLANGDAAFTGTFSQGYLWQFETGTFIDLTPPVVTDYFPFPEDRASPPFPTTTYERNVLIQVNFNEAIDPTSVVNPGNVVVRADGTTVDGSWAIANGYRSVEFVTNEACGENSCGETIYCLPANAAIDVTVRAASLTEDPDDGPVALLPADGVADAAANSLNDQGNNGVSEGPPTDNVVFEFGTSGAIDITGPSITSTEPAILTGDLAADAPVTVSFNEVMSRVSLSTSSITVTPTPDHELWYAIQSTNLTSEGDPVGAGDAPVATRAEARHGLFLRAPVGASPQQGYVPAALSGVRDAYQNCFVPSSGPGPVMGATCTPNPYCCNGTPTDVPSCSGVPISP